MAHDALTVLTCSHVLAPKKGWCICRGRAGDAVVDDMISNYSNLQLGLCDCCTGVRLLLLGTGGRLQTDCICSKVVQDEV